MNVTALRVPGLERFVGRKWCRLYFGPGIGLSSLSAELVVLKRSCFSWADLQLHPLLIQYSLTKDTHTQPSQTATLTQTYSQCTYCTFSPTYCLYEHIDSSSSKRKYLKIPHGFPLIRRSLFFHKKDIKRLMCLCDKSCPVDGRASSQRAKSNLAKTLFVTGMVSPGRGPRPSSVSDLYYNRWKTTASKVTLQIKPRWGQSHSWPQPRQRQTTGCHRSTSNTWCNQYSCSLSFDLLAAGTMPSQGNGLKTRSTSRWPPRYNWSKREQPKVLKTCFTACLIDLIPLFSHSRLGKAPWGNASERKFK